MPLNASLSPRIAARQAVLDIASSGLGPGSWPVEIGWAFLDGSFGGALLIRPEAHWRSAWEPEAEETHGIALDTAVREGASARDAALILSAALRGCSVFSTAPALDGRWLDRLFEVAPEVPPVSLLRYSDLLAAAGLPSSGIGRILDGLATSPAPRRPGDGAAQMVNAWRDALVRV